MVYNFFSNKNSSMLYSHFDALDNASLNECNKFSKPLFFRLVKLINTLVIFLCKLLILLAFKSTIEQFNKVANFSIVDLILSPFFHVESSNCLAKLSQSVYFSSTNSAK